MGSVPARGGGRRDIRRTAPENFDPSEIRANAVKDLAALNKAESLAWDEWGRMTDAFEGRTGEDYDELLDELAAVCEAEDAAAVSALYRNPVLEVPPELLRRDTPAGR